MSSGWCPHIHNAGWRVGVNALFILKVEALAFRTPWRPATLVLLAPVKFFFGYTDAFDPAVAPLHARRTRQWNTALVAAGPFLYSCTSLLLADFLRVAEVRGQAHTLPLCLAPYFVCLAFANIIGVDHAYLSIWIPFKAFCAIDAGANLGLAAKVVPSFTHAPILSGKVDLTTWTLGDVTPLTAIRPLPPVSTILLHATLLLPIPDETILT